MKKTLLFLATLCLTCSCWAQVSEFLDQSNLPIELGNAENPGFTELNNKFYFIGNEGTDVLYSIDLNGTLVTEFDTAGLTGSNSLTSLTTFNGQLYFVASDNNSVNTRKLYRLFGGNTAQLISNDVVITSFDEMIVWDGDLYFSGKLTDTSENGLIRYDGNGNFEVVNTIVPGVDFSISRFAVHLGLNALCFFSEGADLGGGQRFWTFSIAQKNAGNTTISQIGNVDFIDFFSSPPSITEFSNSVYTIGRTQNDSEVFLYQVNGTTLSRVNNFTGYSQASFNDIQTNNGGTSYNGKLAIFRSSTSNNIYDKLDLLAIDNSIQEYDLPTNVVGSQFYNELNDALIFFGRDVNVGSIEYLYEFRENTITDVLPQTRVVHDYLNGVSQRPYYGNTFNGLFYFYGASVNDLSKRVLHVYNPKVLNYDPILNTQEQVTFFGGLGFENITGASFSIQNFTAGGGSAISDLSALSTLKEVPSTILSDSQLTNLSGFENLERIDDIEIFNNLNLANFCALQSWAINNPGATADWIANGNAYNPTFVQVQSASLCQQAVCTPIAVDSSFEAFLENPGNTFLDVNGIAIPNTDISNGSSDGFVCQEGIARIAEIDFTPTVAIDFFNIDEFVAMTKFTLGEIPTATGTSLDLSQNLALEEVNIAPNTFTTFDLPNSAGANLQKVFFGSNGSFTWPTANFTIDLSNSPALVEFSAILASLPTVDLSNSSELITISIDTTSIDDLFLFGCDKLQSVSLDGTSLITSLALSNMPDLNDVLLRNSSIENFSLENTGLTSIFFSEQFDLQEINIVNNTALTTIDFSQNGGVPPTNLARAILTSNNLISLDISTLVNIEELDVINNANLTALQGLTDATKLINLKTYGTDISAIDLSTNDGTLTNLEVGSFGVPGNLTFLNIRNPNLVYNLIGLSADDNPGLCIQVNSVFDAEEAVNQGFWSVDTNPNLFQLNCNVVCTPVNFADANLKAFFLDPNNSTRILDINSNPITDLSVGNEVCAEKVAAVYTLDLSNGYNGNAFTNLLGLETFTNLRDLDISNNNFSPLHVRNVSLERLIADNCVDGSTDVLFREDPNDSSSSVLVNVNEFSFQDNWTNQANAIGPVTFSGVPNAQTANINGSNISGVVFNSTVWNGLEELFANNSSIESIPGINTAISLRRIEASNSNLTGALDLRNNGNLEVFVAEEANISSLTFSDANISLRRVSIFGQGQNDDALNAVNLIGTLPGLSALDISDNNNLTFIDLTNTPFLDSFQSSGTSITRLDFTALQNAGSGNFFIAESGGGSLFEIDVRNNNASFNIADFELDGRGHPNLSCVLVNQGDLAQAQINVTNNVWQFDNANVVRTQCPTCTPIAFADANLRAFFLDPVSSSRILDMNGNPVTGLVVGGEVCQERAGEVYEIDLNNGYNNTPITSLVGLGEMPNLRRLDINLAQLSGAIDLSALTALEVFNAEENNISSLTASNTNTVLRRISIFEQGSANNALTAVNFNGVLSTLSNLDIGGNNALTSIDLTQVPLLDTFQSSGTSITRLDFTALQNAGSGNFFIAESGDGSLVEIDVRNNNASFNIADFELDGRGHPNLGCVLVNQGDLAQAQTNVTNNVWQFDSASAIKTDCAPPQVFEITAFLTNANSISEVEYDYTEGSAQDIEIAFDFQDSNATAQNFGPYDFQISTVNGSAIGGDPALDDSDFFAQLNEEVTLDFDFNGFGLLTIGINDDTLPEGTEFFFIDITENEAGARLKNADANARVRIRVNILDNDAPPPTTFEITPFLMNASSISETEYNYGEGAVQELMLAFDFQDPNATAQNFGPYDFQISTVNSSAIAGSDFGAIANEEVTLDFDFNGFGLLAIAINDDMLDEGTEFFFIDITENETGVTLKNADANGRVRIQVNILDNDGANVVDSDNDGIVDTDDNCPNTPNADQANMDGDEFGDVCDTDRDGDGVLNVDDAFPDDATESSDTDNDNIGDNSDNCPNTSNTDQADFDNDGLGDVCDADDDNDGIPDSADNCPKEVGIAENGGCPAQAPTIDKDDIQVVVLSETCPGENNGSFEVNIANRDYVFTVVLDGTVLGTASFENSFIETNGLTQGSYQVCLRVNEINFEQCFGINIRTYERILVQTNSVSTTELKASFNVQGSKTYEVIVNENRYAFEFESTASNTVDVPIDKGNNNVTITGASDCQGVFTDIIVIGAITIFPNPVVDLLNFEGFEATENAQVTIHNVAGSLVKTMTKNLSDGSFSVEMGELQNGFYFIRVLTTQEKIEFKIIKK